jgi:hypothetical protein
MPIIHHDNDKRRNAAIEPTALIKSVRRPNTVLDNETSKKYYTLEEAKFSKQWSPWESG